MNPFPTGPLDPPDWIAELKDSRTVFLGVFAIDDGDILTGTKELTNEEAQEADLIDLWNAHFNALHADQ